MGRSTFEGPILAGDQRFGQQRDVGLVKLSQYANLVLTNTTAATAGFGGSSGTFVSPNNIPNNIGTIWTPQAGVYSSSGPTVATAPTADSATAIYRGAVFLLPQQSTITAINLDTVVVPTTAAGSITAITPYISNNFATSAGVYATSAALSAVGRTAATFTATQYGNAIVTLQDVQNIQPGQQPTWFTQVVVTLAITGTGLTTINAGQVNITIDYLQNDLNIGNGTTYPYGNFD
jgi:hypothetical protein